MGASFARTDAQKKQHKERSQPFNRQRYGLLEKKKDYVLRSADYKQKQARLKTLRSKAATKNEDEFYFGMIGRTTKNGLARKDRGNTALSQDVTKVLKTQDVGYIKTVAAIERKKLEAMRQSLHVPASGRRRDGDDKDEGEGARGEARTHAVFVDSVEEALALDPVARLRTTAENLSARPENRLADTRYPSTDPAERLARRRLRADKVKFAKELASRERRLDKLRVMEKESAVHRLLQGKGARRKVGTDKDGISKYKWKQERKR